MKNSLLLRKPIGFIVILCLILTSVFATPIVASAADKTMTIHAIFLGHVKKILTEGEKKGTEVGVGGDAVLLESQDCFLLMDMGDSRTSNYVIDYLNSVIGNDATGKQKRLDIYVSHLHPDHYGAYKKIFPEFEITTLYLPDKSMTERDVTKVDSNRNGKYERLTKWANAETVPADIVYLKPNSSFPVGDAKVTIIGAIGDHKSNPNPNKLVNNSSLVAMVDCGDTKYLTAGDIEKVEELVLFNKNIGVKATIMKMSHHGLHTSNIAKFVKRVSPTYSFIQTKGRESLLNEPAPSAYDGKGKFTQGYSARMEASKTGFCYNLGTENTNFILKVVGSRVTMYKGSVSSANVLSGWVKLTSDNGVKKIKTGNRVYDKYYIDSKGKPKTGVQTINGKTYFFGEGGLMERGLYDKKGGYLPKRKYNVGTVKNPIYKYRYFYQTGGSMRVGYKDKHHYNAKTGFMVVDKICKSRHYNKDGKMSSGWTTVKGKKYYFSKGNGLMYTGKKSIGTKWYKFNKKGVRTHKKVSGKWKKYDAKGQKLK